MEDRAIINKDEFDIKSPLHVCLFRVLTLLEICSTLTLHLIKLSERDNADRSGDFIIYSTIMLAFISEAANTFYDCNIQLDENWPSHVKESYKLLYSEEVRSREGLYVTFLKKIRGKASFHIVPDTIKQFMKKKLKVSEEIVIIGKFDDEELFSPIAREILADKHLSLLAGNLEFPPNMEELLSNEEVAIRAEELINEVYGGIREVINQVIKDTFPSFRRITKG